MQLTRSQNILTLASLARPGGLKEAAAPPPPPLLLRAFWEGKWFAPRSSPHPPVRDHSVTTAITNQGKLWNSSPSFGGGSSKEMGCFLALFDICLS